MNNLPLDKSDVIGEFKIPNETFFKAVNGTDDEMPYLKFYKWLAVEMNMPLKEVEVTKVCTSRHLEARLERYMHYWAKRNRPFIKPGTKRFEADMAMLKLAYGTVMIDEPWVEDDVVYIRRLP